MKLWSDYAASKKITDKRLKWYGHVISEYIVIRMQGDEILVKRRGTLREARHTTE